MATDITCPRCGAANRPGTAFCVNCGSPLGAEVPPAAGAPPAYPSMAPPPYAQGYAGPWEQDRRTQIDRTKTGVLILLIGTLLSWIPFVGALGSLLVLIGAILVILGRKAFGPAHARNVLISIVVVILGILVSAASLVVLLFGVARAFIPGGPPPTPEAVRSAFTTFLIVFFVGGAITGLSSVIFTYAIQDRTGRMLLIGGYAAGLLVNLAIVLILNQAISDFVSLMFPGGTYSQTAASAAILQFQARVTTYTLLSGIPAVLYGAAYYLVWSRINRGEIPAPPAGAPGMPPTGPAPPINPM